MLDLSEYKQLQLQKIYEVLPDFAHN